MATKTRTKYEANSGEVYSIILTPEYAAKAGTAPTGAVTNDIKIKVSKGSKEFGLSPRKVILARTIGTAPDTFVKYSSLPVLTPTAFGTATYALNATIEIDGNTWTIVGKKSEDYN